MSKTHIHTKYVEDVIERAETEIHKVTGIRVKLSWRIATWLPAEEIATIVEGIVGLKPGDIEGNRRYRKNILARQIFVLIVKEIYPESRLTDIARVIKKDHTTIINSYRRAKAYREVSDPLFMYHYTKCLDIIYNNGKNVETETNLYRNGPFNSGAGCQPDDFQKGAGSRDTAG